VGVKATVLGGLWALEPTVLGGLWALERGKLFFRSIDIIDDTNTFQLK